VTYQIIVISDVCDIDLSDIRKPSEICDISERDIYIYIYIYISDICDISDERYQISVTCKMSARYYISVT
jgi:hypothetical protein